MVAIGSFIKRHSLVLFFLLLTVSVQASSDFSWSDCGVQLTKDIHYESATISTSPLGKGPISINIKAAIVNTIYGADTWLVIYKDNELFLNVQIQNLCDIISTTTTLSCPLSPGPLSFTYTFKEIPPMPKGFYTFQIRSFSNYVGPQVNYVEQGCLSLSGTAGNLGLTSNTYTSSFTVTLTGTPTFQVADYTQRTKGHTLTVGTNGKYGAFASTLKATTDLVGSESSIDTQGYSWLLSGQLNNISNSDTSVFHYYGGYFEIYAPGDDDTPFFQGTFNLTNIISTTGTAGQTLSGSLAFDPKYVYDSSKFAYPIVIGNMEPFQLQMLPDGSTYTVSGTRTWCTVGVDGCGVCGGDGKTCGLSAITPSSDNAEWTDKQKAAVAIGVGGGVLGLVAITVLAIMITRARRAPYYDDTDLIDHPQKPDYGTMAIDDIMREGERAPY